MEFKTGPDIEKKEPHQTSLKEGTAKFVVVQAAEKIGKESGKSYIQLSLQIIGAETGDGLCNSGLFSSEKTWWVRKDFCESIGQPSLYSSGTIEAPLLVGMNGRCKLKLRSPDKNGNVYMDVKYLPREEGDIPPPAMIGEDAVPDEDIPF